MLSSSYFTNGLTIIMILSMIDCVFKTCIPIRRIGKPSCNENFRLVTISYTYCIIYTLNSYVNIKPKYTSYSYTYIRHTHNDTRFQRNPIIFMYKVDELQGSQIKRLNNSDKNKIVLSAGSFFFFLTEKRL